MTLGLLVYKIKVWLTYYWRASTKYNIQSPFFTGFIREVMDFDKQYYVFDTIENQRKILLTDNSKIPRIDFGAGSHKLQKKDTVQIKEIAKSSLSSKNQCRLLFNLIVWKKPKTIIELGTSLGISTAYLASVNKNILVTGFEGNPYVAEKAKNILSEAGLGHVSVLTGPFKDSLPGFLQTTAKIDVAYIDGHHEELATLSYFEMILPYLSEQAVVIFDDIYWSQGMENAWKIVCQHKSVSATIDCFDIGIVFMRPGLTKENIIYIPYHFKPWKIGLFGR